MNILLSGCCGFMGAEVINAVKQTQTVNIVAGVDIVPNDSLGFPCSKSFENTYAKVDCIIDFSNHSSTNALLDFAVKNNIPVCIATTGQTESEKNEIIRASENIPIFFASNYCLGIALLIQAAKKIASALPDSEIEIIEYHHSRKADAPSGTALSIFNALNEIRPNAYPNLSRHSSGKRDKSEIGISSVRIGNICGIHEIIIGNESQTITLKHEANTRKVFAEGALVAAEYLLNKRNGLYKIEDLINDYINY